jgi:hypothetical protein
LWNRQRLDSPSPSQRTPVDRNPIAPQFPAPVAPSVAPTSSDPSVTEIRSASTELLNSENMEDLRKLLKDAYEERTTLQQEVAAAEREHGIAMTRYRSWDNGFLFKRVFKRAFAARREVSETAQAKLEELREQLRLTTLATQIEMDPQQAEPYYKMRDDFAALTECQRIWDTLERRTVNRVVERSAAHEAITRAPVAFALGYCDLIQWDQKIPHLPNRNGGDMYVYPGFILYRASRQAFALINCREVTLTFKIQNFIEDQPVPTDTQVVGQAWAKSNKDGSPDRRFTTNYQIPVVLYGSLVFASPSGLHEEYQCSNPALAERLAKAWSVFHASLLGTGQEAPPSALWSRIAIRDLDGPHQRFKRAWEAFSNIFLTVALAGETNPDGNVQATVSTDDLSAYFRALSEFIEDVKGFAADVSSSLAALESLGAPKRKLSQIRALQSPFKQSLERLDIERSRFENILITEKPFTTEDFTAYLGATTTFMRAFTTFRDGTAAAIEKLAESFS